GVAQGEGEGESGHDDGGAHPDAAADAVPDGVGNIEAPQTNGKLDRSAGGFLRSGDLVGMGPGALDQLAQLRARGGRVVALDGDQEGLAVRDVESDDRKDRAGVDGGAALLADGDARNEAAGGLGEQARREGVDGGREGAGEAEL